MYIVSSNNIHPETITIFGSFKWLHKAKKFIKDYNESVQIFLDSFTVKRYLEYQKDINSDEFKKKQSLFPNDRVLQATINLSKKYHQSYLKSARLHGIELDENGTPFIFTEDPVEYIDRIDYPINIKIKEGPNWRKEV